MTPQRPRRLCARCGEVRTHQGRGLCNRCYMACHTDGTLLDYERTLRPPELTIADYLLLSEAGETDARIAERLGYADVDGMRKVLRQHGVPYRLSERAPSAHGTIGRYMRHGCRCEACRAANAAKQRKHQARKRAAA